uniref:Uncharacterized protein n=1 Tax=Arundo donax TaxID=35708 RepID=A0A0A9B6W9_ARUDO
MLPLLETILYRDYNIQILYFYLSVFTFQPKDVGLKGEIPLKF